MKANTDKRVSHFISELEQIDGGALHFYSCIVMPCEIHRDAPKQGTQFLSASSASTNTFRGLEPAPDKLHSGHLCLWEPTANCRLAPSNTLRLSNTHIYFPFYSHFLLIFNFAISGITDLVRSHFILNFQLCKGDSSSARIQCEL